MTKKKGFTLIELLAVIAILAILAIIAVPSVIKMYKNTKKSAFLTEAKNVYKAANNQFMASQVDGTNETSFCNAGTGAKDIELSAPAAVKYKIAFDASGTITSFQMSNGSYNISKTTGTIDPSAWTDEDVTDGTITITCP